MSPRLGITMGDPLGVGAEIINSVYPKFRGKAELVVFGDSRYLPDLDASEIQNITELNIPGAVSAQQAGEAAFSYLEAAMAAYRSGRIDGLVTAPISKHHMQLAGFPYPGHTEYLAAKTETSDYVMMMVGETLKVSLVTIHCPHQKVASSITLKNIIQTIKITYESMMRYFGKANPKIAVCGLNPHAGESGLLGSEEIDLIAPAITEAQRLGYPCEGPKVPDAIFYEAYAGAWDAVVCMYHDQGLIPFKMIHFADGVNVTLGLPLVRTSPDHGTAFDIAGKGIANTSSMEASINLALEMLAKRGQA